MVNKSSNICVFQHSLTTIRRNSVIYYVKFDNKSRHLFKKLPEEIKQYFREIDEKCKKHGITFRISGGRGLNIMNGRCSGFFSDFSKELAIAINKPSKWILATLAHEESHLDQWLDENSVWYDREASEKFDLFFQWLNGEVELKSPQDCARKAILIELDCEKRTLKKIKKRWSHIISPEDYSMSANAYMFSYLYMAESRNWIKAKIRRKVFYRNFPKKILNKFENLSNEQLKLFYKHEKAAPQTKGGF